MKLTAYFFSVYDEDLDSGDEETKKLLENAEEIREKEKKLKMVVYSNIL